MRQTGPSVRALRQAVARLLSKNMTCSRPQRNATPSKHFLHTAHCNLHTPHFTLNTCTSHSILHLISSELFSPRLSFFHLMSSLVICQLNSTHLFPLHRSTAQPFHLTEASLKSSHLFCTSERMVVAQAHFSLVHREKEI